jgi:hypothetical protein
MVYRRSISRRCSCSSESLIWILVWRFRHSGGIQALFPWAHGNFWGVDTASSWHHTCTSHLWVQLMTVRALGTWLVGLMEFNVRVENLLCIESISKYVFQFALWICYGLMASAGGSLLRYGHLMCVSCSDASGGAMAFIVKDVLFSVVPEDNASWQ